MPGLPDLSKRTAKTLGVPDRAVRAVIEQFFVETAAALLAGEGVYLRGFGAFGFGLQRCNEAYYRERGVVPEGDGELRVRICRFRFVKRLREQLNGLQLDKPEPDRINYKRRANGLLGVNGETEAQRRARVGITIGDICARLNFEVDP